jgi:murein DD-endopeptidase MepM/ murein hydrolase activator NlpD
MDLRLPFVPGTRVLSGQGHNAQFARATHRAVALRYSIDFAEQVPGLPIDGAHYPAAFRAGTPVVSAAAGKVYVYGGARDNAADNWGYGNAVLIDHGNGYATLYAHLRDTRVTTGQVVRQGERIGSIGQTGNAGPPGGVGGAAHPHLHFQVVRLTRTPVPMLEQHHAGDWPRDSMGRLVAAPWEPAGVPYLVTLRDMSAGGALQRLSSFDVKNAEYGVLWDEAHVYAAP